MSIEKSELKMLFSGEIGSNVEDMLEAAKSEVSSFSGAKTGLIQAEKKVEELTTHLDKLRDEGGMEQEAYVAAKDWVCKSAGVVRNLATAADVNRLVCQGKVQALQQTVDYIKKIYNTEKAKIEALKENKTDVLDVSSARVEGTHPGLPLSVKRKMEDASKAVVQAEEKLVEKVIEQPASEFVKTVEEPVASVVQLEEKSATSVEQPAEPEVLKTPRRRKLTLDGNNP